MQEGLRLNLQQLLRASARRGLYVPVRGELLELSCPKAIGCGIEGTDALGPGTIRIPVPPSRLLKCVLGEQALDEIADKFQPRLLGYRLKNLARMREPHDDFPQLTFPIRRVARDIAMLFPEDSQLASDAVRLLDSQNDEIRASLHRDVNFAIVEILWNMSRRGNVRQIGVHELTKNVNALLRSHGEILDYSPEQIGWQLKALNVSKHRTAAGQEVLLDAESRKRMDELAHTYDLTSEQK